MPSTAPVSAKPAPAKTRPVAARAPAHPVTGPQPVASPATPKAPALPAFVRSAIGSSSAATSKADPLAHSATASPEQPASPTLHMPELLSLAAAAPHPTTKPLARVAHPVSPPVTEGSGLGPRRPTSPSADSAARTVALGPAHPAVLKTSMPKLMAPATPMTGQPAVQRPAVHTAKAVHPAAPRPHPKLAPLVPAKGAGLSSGQSLAPHIKEALQNSLLVDLSSVRLHASTAAQRKAQSALRARLLPSATTFSFFGHGEHPTDLTLITHEVAHVIQQQGEPAMQMWIPSDRSDRYEREADLAASAVQRGETFSVRERVDSPRVQRLGISDAARLTSPMPPITFPATGCSPPLFSESIRSTWSTSNEAQPTFFAP